MEKKINLSELLKDCPKGMELDCTLFDDVKFETVANNSICIRLNNGESFTLSPYGNCIGLAISKCVIYPKGKTTWEGFVPPCKFKDGDIVATTRGSWIGITKGGENNSFIPTYCVIDCNDEFEAYFDRKEQWSFSRLATEEEKERLFQAIKDNGYQWNDKTKTLEKLIEPKFKVGDKVKHIYNSNQYVIDKITDTHYTIIEITKKYRYSVRISEDKNWELVPNKFDITTLVPFESKVLVRDDLSYKWCPAIWGFYDEDGCDYHYEVVGGYSYSYCIPYKENEHLLGTTNDCDEFYKTW